jgi:hypothetical protein
VTRPHLCACGRYIKPQGWASHKRNCPDYQTGLQSFLEAAGLAPTGKPDPWPFPVSAHNWQSQKQKG